jgi:hypothetical protein
MAPRRPPILRWLAAALAATALGAGLLTPPAAAGMFGNSWSCKFCTYGANKCCNPPPPTILNECNGYFPTRWSPWPCPYQHVPVMAPRPVPSAPSPTPYAPAAPLPPAKIMPPVR